jgi:hypothetical protein
LTFLFDEQLPIAVVAALGQTEQPARHVISEGLQGASDEDLFAYAGPRGWYFVTANTEILRKPQQRAALLDAKLGAFFFTGRAKRSYFDWLELIVRRWKDIIRYAETHQAPFVAKVPDRGVIRPFKLPRRR